MTSAVNNINHINTLNTRFFTGETFKGQKTPKALVIHLVNETSEFFQKDPQTLTGLFQQFTEDQIFNYTKIPN